MISSAVILKRIAIVIGVLLIAPMAASCSASSADSSAALIDPELEVSNHPSVTPEQAERILGSVDEALASASGDPAKVQGRAIGSYLEAMTAAHKLATADKTPPAAYSPPAERVVVVPVASTWPRFLVRVGQRSGKDVAHVQLFSAPSAREPYGLFGDLTLLPEAELPAFPEVGVGATILDPASSGELGYIPNAALKMYADVLTNGAKSTFGERFAADDFTTEVLTRQQEEQELVQGSAEVSSVHEPVLDGTLVLQTSDGRAVMWARMRHVTTVKVPEGSPGVNVDSPRLRTLMGTEVIRKEATMVATEWIAMVIPQSESEQLAIIAAAKEDTSAVGS